MSNPQKENGNVGIANEIFDALCKIRIPGEAYQVLNVIFRQTYGWNKKKDGIALSTFCLRTGISKRNICRAIETLQKMNLIIVVKDNARWNTYEVNKHFDTWKPLSKRTTLSKKTMAVVVKDNASLSKKTPSINNSSINTITKNNEVGEIPTHQPKKIKNLTNGETDRGKEIIFDNFLDRCKEKHVIAAISLKKYFDLQNEYKNKIVWWEEVKGCINWLYDNGFKSINAQRIRKRMDNAIKFGKEKELRKLQEYQDKKFSPPQFKKITQIPIWTPPS